MVLSKAATVEVVISMAATTRVRKLAVSAQVAMTSIMTPLARRTLQWASSWRRPGLRCTAINSSSRVPRSELSKVATTTTAVAATSAA